MRILLAAINAKYIHSNPGIHSLKAAAEYRLGEEAPEILLGEYTINHNTDSVRADIYRCHPDILAFSCYIWNIAYVRTLVRDLKRLLPETQIWLGGPEVSWHGEQILQQYPEVTGIMVGPGEETFASLCRLWRAEEGSRAEKIPGLVLRSADGGIICTGQPDLMPLSEIPFWYEDLTEFTNRIIYYESSRGCPFSCSYCLSSIDKCLQFREPEQVTRELQFFLDRRVPQVKFIDRTFNCRERHALVIWQYIADHDNGVTNFHFEIAADLLTDREMEILAGMRPGLVQLEIGVQSTNMRTVKEIRRVMDLAKVRKNVARIHRGNNIHQHLDLIAGLPWEDYESFGHSFDDVYAMRPEQLQLGFLKVLKGAYMEEMTETYGMIYTAEPPYEVLSTQWLSYEDILRLKAIEEMVEVYYNSGQFGKTLAALCEFVGRPFLLYEKLADYHRDHGIKGQPASRIRKYENLLAFACEIDPAGRERYRELLTEDCYLREHMKNRPAFASDQSEEEWENWKDFLRRESVDHHRIPGWEGASYREMMHELHGEVRGEEWMIFDYRHRDPLTGNARVYNIK